MATSQLKPPTGLQLTGNLSENWRKFKQRFEIYSVASGLNEKAEEIQVASLLHLVGEEALEVFNTFQFTAEDDKKKIKPVCEQFEAYCSPRKNVTYERYKFFTHVQGSKSIDVYITELKGLSKQCEFGDLCDSLIRDRIVCGIQSNYLRERLLREPELSLTKAIDICRASEVSKTQAQYLNESSKVLEEKVDFVQKQNKSRQTCYNCGTVHRKNQCPAFGKDCHACGKPNHFKSVCKSKPKDKSNQPKKSKGNRGHRSKVHYVDESSTDESEEMFIGAINNEGKASQWNANITINGKITSFKIDTGAQCNVISQKLFDEIRRSEIIVKSRSRLFAYNNEKIPIKGKVELLAEYKSKYYVINFKVVDMNVPPVLGLPTCESLNLVQRVMTVGNDQGYTKEMKSNDQNKILREFIDVFDGLGRIGEHHIVTDQSVPPTIHPARRVPFALKGRLQETLEQLVQKGVISKVTGPTDWVNSLVIIEKKDESLRLCLDPRDLNTAIKREHYQVPTAQEITSNLAGAKYFSTLDAKDGFWQVELDKKSSDLCTFNTPFGRYKFLRMPFGILSAAEVFQKKMIEAFEDIEGVQIIYDDILVTGKTVEEHDETLRKVLQRARERRIKFNKKKMKFRITEVKYIGDVITADGLKPDDSKIKAICDFKTPANKQDVMRLLGMVNYLGKYIPNMATITKPLRDLLKENIVWQWGHIQEETLKQIKTVLTSQPILKFYDASKPCKISVDASKSGLGAVLLQDDNPIAYASRSLTESQQRWAQIEKEMYAVVFGCERFNQFIYGKHTIIETDHKPLQSIIKKPLSQAPTRIQRLLLRLQRYDIDLQYRPGKELVIADALSRAYVSTRYPEDKELDDEIDFHVHSIISSVPISKSKFDAFKAATAADRALQELSKTIRNGWPELREQVPNEIKNFWNYRDEIHEIDGVLFKGEKIIVPESLKQSMLSLIHEVHLGVQKSLYRARQSLFWPGMTQEVKGMVENCPICLKYRRKQQKEPLIPFKVPELPWQRIAADLFHLGSEEYLLVIDYYSKYVELAHLSQDATSPEVIKHLKSIMARHGIPQELISDNGPQFISKKFENFSKTWEFDHDTSSPKFASSNGQVERAVQTVKSVLRKAVDSKRDPYLALLEYRNTPIDNDIGSPAELLFQRKLRTKLPCKKSLLKPRLQSKDTRNKLIVRQQKQKFYHDKNAKPLKELDVGDTVRLRREKEWIPAKVVEKDKHPRSYHVTTEQGTTYRRNRRDIVKTNEDPVVIKEHLNFENEMLDSEKPECQSEKVQVRISPSRIPVPEYRTRSGRLVKKPIRYGQNS